MSSQTNICVPQTGSEDNDNPQLTGEKSHILDDKQVLLNSQPAPQKMISRKKFLKPQVNLNSIRQRNVQKVNVDVPPADVATTPLPEACDDNITKANDKVILLHDVQIKQVNEPPYKVASNITKMISSPSSDSTASCSEINLNEAHFSTADSSSVVTFSSVEKSIPEMSVSDSEYPIPPPSPSKINRSRIKAIPKLFRKTSCSASESEDETRKYGRIRNNSVCSTASASCQELPTPSLKTSLLKEAMPATPKKLNRTDQSRRLAEARREFYKRCGVNEPDKQKLKMIDFIYYNPLTNPMSQKTNSNNKAEALPDTIVDVEQPVDDPLALEEPPREEKEQEVDAMPVPQIKIGPSGEIILDEQSLIIENAEVAKQKELIKNSEIVDGDFDTGYGIYKRAARMHNWTANETLRFYKALNLLGTDFSIMTQLFPKRDRRALKMKFKKEEKINRHLIDKVLTQPCTFNFRELKREIEIEEGEEAFLQKLKEEELQKFRQQREARREITRKKKNLEQGSGEMVDPASLPFKKRLVEVQPKPRKLKVKKPLNIHSILNEDDADISDMTQSDTDEEEIIPFLKPTRSGRMPKSTIKFFDLEEPPRRRLPKRPIVYAKPEVSKPRIHRLSSTSSIDSNSERLIPGSVVITAEEDLTSENKYKVFMVTPERKLTPLELDSEVVARLVKERQSASEFPAPPPLIERNVTIPAEKENESSLTKDEDTEVF